MLTLKVTLMLILEVEVVGVRGVLEGLEVKLISTMMVLVLVLVLVLVMMSMLVRVPVLAVAVVALEFYHHQHAPTPFNTSSAKPLLQPSDQ
jgi:hypothetical protein